MTSLDQQGFLDPYVELSTTALLGFQKRVIEELKAQNLSLLEAQKEELHNEIVASLRSFIQKAKDDLAANPSSSSALLSNLQNGPAKGRKNEDGKALPPSSPIPTLLSPPSQLGGPVSVSPVVARQSRTPLVLERDEQQRIPVESRTVNGVCGTGGTGWAKLPELDPRERNGSSALCTQNLTLHGGTIVVETGGKAQGASRVGGKGRSIKSKRKKKRGARKREDLKLGLGSGPSQQKLFGVQFEEEYLDDSCVDQSDDERGSFNCLHNSLAKNTEESGDKGSPAIIMDWEDLKERPNHRLTAHLLGRSEIVLKRGAMRLGRERKPRGYSRTRSRLGDRYGSKVTQVVHPDRSERQKLDLRQERQQAIENLEGISKKDDNRGATSSFPITPASPSYLDQQDTSHNSSSTKDGGDGNQRWGEEKCVGAGVIESGERDLGWVRAPNVLGGSGSVAARGLLDREMCVDGTEKACGNLLPHRRQRRDVRTASDTAPALADEEWENEVARSILQLYSAKVRADKSTLTGGGAVSHYQQSDSSIETGFENIDPCKSGGKVIRPPQEKILAGKISSGPPRRAGASAIKVPKQSKQIWFAGTGSVHAVWCALVPGSGSAAVAVAVTDIWCDVDGGSGFGQDAVEEKGGGGREGVMCRHRWCSELRALEKAGKFSKYIAVVKAALDASHRSLGVDNLGRRLQRQLVVTAGALGQRAAEQGRNALALDLLKWSERMAASADFPAAERAELKSFAWDGLSCYYYRRRKPAAALQYASKAQQTHVRQGAWAHAAKAQLHCGAALAAAGRHQEAIHCIAQVLKMAEDGRLEVGGGNSQKVCMVAVAYHNVAVEQLALRKIGEACVSSQNARRLARLSLSYSNRWLRALEATHKLALAELAARNAVLTLENRSQRHLFENLTTALFE